MAYGQRSFPRWLTVDPAYHPNTPRKPVDTFPLKVMGGTFTVAEVMLAPGQNPGQDVESIRAQPFDRWLVMTAGQDVAADALALINDAYECQVMALGSLTADES